LTELIYYIHITELCTYSLIHNPSLTIVSVNIPN